MNGSRPEELFASEIRLGPLVQDDGMGWDAEPDLIDLIDLI